MFLTKECDYAIRVVRGLADLEIKPVKSICEYQQIPLPFAYKILKKLERAGVVCPRRGAGGGYRLAKAPEDITLFAIVTAVDENLFVNQCLRKDYVCPLNSGGNCCGVHREFVRIQELLMNALREKKISEML